jgi:hypothetical protein
MPKPKSPERPKAKVAPPQHKTVPKRDIPKTPKSVPEMNVQDEVFEDVQLTVPSNVQLDTAPSQQHSGVYPALIRELLSVCVGEASDVRGAFKNRNRLKYKNIFENYKDKLSQRDYSIIKGALFYLYDFSRVKSIDKDTALWMLGIYEIPTSQIISYTSKEVLKSIAKDHGLSYSNKKAEDLVESIRGVIDPSQ